MPCLTNFPYDVGVGLAGAWAPNGSLLLGARRVQQRKPKSAPWRTRVQRSTDGAASSALNMIVVAAATAIARAALDSSRLVIIVSLVTCILSWLFLSSRGAALLGKGKLLPPGVRRPVIISEHSALGRLVRYSSQHQHWWIRELINKKGPVISMSFPVVGNIVIIVCDGPAIRSITTGQTQLRKARIYERLAEVSFNAKSTSSHRGFGEVRKQNVTPFSRDLACCRLPVAGSK